MCESLICEADLSGRRDFVDEAGELRIPFRLGSELPDSLLVVENLMAILPFVRVCARGVSEPSRTGLQNVRAHTRHFDESVKWKSIDWQA